MVDKKADLKDLEYELQILLGASLIIDQLEVERKLRDGNIVNYFKDSAYIHIRNLYEFFLSDPKKTNDSKVSAFTNHKFNLSFYLLWREPLNRHVLHIAPGRNNPNNVKNGKHLKDQIPSFAKNIEDLWTEWIRATADDQLKQKLENTLADAKRHAQNDCDKLLGEIDKGADE